MNLNVDQWEFSNMKSREKFLKRNKQILSELWKKMLFYNMSNFRPRSRKVRNWSKSKYKDCDQNFPEFGRTCKPGQPRNI